MNVPQIRRVRVIDPIGPAIERIRTILFRPFDVEKWFLIGFCAWLAQLGHGGGGGGGNRVQHRIDRESIRHQMGQAWEYVVHKVNWIVPVAITVAGVLIGLWLLVLWLSSRGRFMFLYCVAQNKAEVTHPWQHFRGHANSLFAIPYLGTVLLLPFHVFGRSYSLHYLAQYGPEFNVFEPLPGPTATPGQPRCGNQEVERG
jgi:hypothetical protein